MHVVQIRLYPNPQTTVFPDSLFALEKIHITRFHSGSHNVFIECWKIPRELKVCLCGNNVQTFRHVFLDNRFTTASEF